MSTASIVIAPLLLAALGVSLRTVHVSRRNRRIRQAEHQLIADLQDAFEEFRLDRRRGG